MIGNDPTKDKAKQMWQLTTTVLISTAIMCGGTAVATSEKIELSDLQGKWVLETLDGATVNEDGRVHFEIRGNAITGYDGCNRFGGALNSPERMRMSQRGCSKGRLRVPLELPNIRNQLTSGTLTDGRLRLTDDSGKVEASFVRSP